MAQLTPHHLYRIVYKMQAGNGSWYKYEATMSFLGQNKHTNEYTFNFRPLAGTSTLKPDQVLIAEDLGLSNKRDDHRHRLPKSLGRMPKESSD